MPGPRRRRWGSAAAAGWAVVLLVLAYVSVHGDRPTVREQRSIAQAAPVVERAIGELVVAAGPDVVVEISGPRVTAGCRLSVIRHGASLASSVTFRTTPAAGPALLKRIADRLPSGYRAGVGHEGANGDDVLRADAGDFVGLEGRPTDPGVIELTASTGCRPASPASGVASPPGSPADDRPARVLARLGATDVRPVAGVAIACPGGGTARTDRATGLGAPAVPLDKALPRPAGAVLVADGPDLYAYRSGSLSLVVRAADGQVQVAATTGCG